MKRYGRSILPIPREGGKSIKELAKEYWGTTGMIFQLWNMGGGRFIIIAGSGNDVEMPGTIAKFQHDQNFSDLGRGSLVASMKWENLDPVVKRFKVRSLYTYK